MFYCQTVKRPGKAGLTINRPWPLSPSINKNELLLIRQYRVPIHGQNLLEIPAGSMDRREESPAECAQRELAEETGLSGQAS